MYMYLYNDVLFLLFYEMVIIVLHTGGLNILLEIFITNTDCDIVWQHALTTATPHHIVFLEWYIID